MNIHQIIAVIWGASEIFLNRLLRSAKSDKTHSDKQSLRIIWITIFIALPLAQVLMYLADLPIMKGDLIYITGVSLIVAGMLYRFAAVYMLGRYFTVDVAIRNDHKIVQRGLYKYTRHPSYLGSLVSFFGNGLAFNNWLALNIGFIPVLIAFIYRIKVEEELLVSNFGEEYLIYKRKTWRLIPLVY